MKKDFNFNDGGRSKYFKGTGEDCVIPRVSNYGDRERKAYCSDCCCETIQHPTYIIPDNPEDGEVWTCSICHESVAIV